MIKFDQYLLEQVLFEKNKRREIELSGRREIEPNLKNISSVLDNYYIYHKLNLYCSYLSYSGLVKEAQIPYSRSDFLLLQEILEIIEKEGSQHPIVLLYNEIRKLFELNFHSGQDCETYYTAVKRMIEAHSFSIAKEDLIEIYSFLTNFCIKQLNKGQGNFSEFFFEADVQIINLKLEIAKTEKTSYWLVPGIFINLVVTALSVQNMEVFNRAAVTGISPDPGEDGFRDPMEWTQKFIRYYSRFLAPEFRKTYATYCMALLAFRQKNFEEAYRLSGVPLRKQGIFINLKAKTLQLMILYELFIRDSKLLSKDKIDIENVLDALRKMIGDEGSRKNQLADDRLGRYKDFEQCFKQLYRFYDITRRIYKKKDREYQTKWKELEDRIAGCNPVSKAWLEEKIIELQ